MPKIDLGNGEVEYRCTARTLTIYEQAFVNDPNPKITGDLIADVFGRQRIGEDALGLEFDDSGNIKAIIVDYTMDNWNAEWRALWAMLKTQAEIDAKHNVKRDPVPSYSAWSADLAEFEPDMRETSNAVMDELNRGLFRTGAAASE